MADLAIIQAHMTPGSAADERRGLLGFVRLELAGGLILDGLALRRSNQGRRYIAYPAREGGDGQRHYSVRPVDDRARLAWEQRVFAALGWEDDRSHSASNGTSSTVDSAGAGKRDS